MRPQHYPVPRKHKNFLILDLNENEYLQLLFVEQCYVVIIEHINISEYLTL